ncbi:hypothetical protein B0H13DRAFT_1886907 [Mycena leptocephala]|nr:hypothetical protein B0H13DRAFT_1886907 [Mycena leptocephala]
MGLHDPPRSKVYPSWTTKPKIHEGTRRIIRLNGEIGKVQPSISGVKELRKDTRRHVKNQGVETNITAYTVRQNKNDCNELLEQTYELLNAILMVHINSDTGTELPPRPSTKSTHLLKLNRRAARSRISSAKVPMVHHMKDLTQMQKDAERRHKEVLDMIEVLLDTTSSDGASSV